VKNGVIIRVDWVMNEGKIRRNAREQFLSVDTSL